MNHYLIECCANSIQSAINGEKGGSNRIELCSNLELGGVTPKRQDILKTKKILNIPMNVLIRPRGGDFIYSRNELYKMLSDIQFCKKIRCNGVVIGSLNKDGSINQLQSTEMVNMARPMEVTFHRAFDESKDIANDLEAIINCGCDRLLTSGKKDNIMAASDNLKTIIKLANNRIKIIAASGVNYRNIEKLYKIGIKEFHLSGKTKNKDGAIETSEELIRLAVTKTKNLA